MCVCWCVCVLGPCVSTNRGCGRIVSVCPHLCCSSLVTDMHVNAGPETPCRAPLMCGGFFLVMSYGRVILLVLIEQRVVKPCARQIVISQIFYGSTKCRTSSTVMSCGWTCLGHSGPGESVEVLRQKRHECGQTKYVMPQRTTRLKLSLTLRTSSPAGQVETVGMGGAWTELQREGQATGPSRCLVPLIPSFSTVAAPLPQCGKDRDDTAHQILQRRRAPL